MATKKTATKNVIYSEPVDFLPKSIRKEYKLGEYSETAQKAKAEAKASKAKTAKKSK